MDKTTIDQDRAWEYQSDMTDSSVASDCCGAPVIAESFCADCKEHCGSAPVVDEDAPTKKDRGFTPEQEATIERLKADS